MRDKKAQDLPLRQIIIAAMVLLVLVVVAMIGPGGIKTGFNNILRTIGLMDDEDAATGDYILQAYVEMKDENTFLLHFSANPLRCAKIRESNPYTIDEGFAPGLTDYIPPSGFKEEAATIGDRSDNCDANYEIAVPMTNPGGIGTRILRINVYGAEQGGVLETVPVDATWEPLLYTYLNAEMEPAGAGSLSDPHNSPIHWSLTMHTEKRGLGNHPFDQSMNMNSGRLEGVKDILGLEGSSIDNIPDFTGGNFKDFLVKLGCAYPDGHPLGGQLNIKTDTMQTIMTAMFGDIQDFNEESGEPDHPDQPVPRIRDGLGLRGYTSIVNSRYKNQLLPTFIEAHYPHSDFDNGFTIFGQVRAHGEYISWKPSEPSATSVFDTPRDSCFEGRPITVKMYTCPQSDSACKIISQEGEVPEPEPEEPEPQDPGEMEGDDCFVSSMDPCGSSVYYIEDGDWICMYDMAAGVDHARHCEDGTISEVRDCSCEEHACEMSSSLDEEWGCG